MSAFGIPCASTSLCETETEASHLPVYYALFPRGIEDVVRHELELVAPPLHIVWQLPLPPKRLLHESLIVAGNPKDRKALPSIEVPPECIGGVLYFTLHNHTSNTPATVEETAFFISAARRIRCVEFIALLLVRFPCLRSLDEVNAPLSHATHRVRWSVVEHLSALRVAAATRSHPLRGFDGPYFTSPVTDDTVMYRVHGVRRDKTVPCAFSSQNLAARVGEVLFDALHSFGWRVNMLYHNVEFLVVQEASHAYMGLLLTPPPLPRSGAAVRFTAQLGLELLRQRIGDAVRRGEGESAAFKAAIPRPGSVANELRVEKGANAMSPSLASALCHYAGVSVGDVVVDPFAGSGSILVEAWVRAGFGPLTLLGGDVYREDAVRSMCNIQTETLFLAAVQGILTACHVRWERDETVRLCRELLRVTERFVETMPLPYFWDNKQNGGSALNPFYPTATPTASQDIVELLKKSLEWHFQASTLLVHWDATRIPIRSGSVDCVVSDLPFGRRCGNHKVNGRLYPNMLKEMYRILRDPPSTQATNSASVPYMDNEDNDASSSLWWLKSNGVNENGRKGRAVLLTIEGRLMMESLQAVRDECPFTLLHTPFMVEMGGLFPYIFALQKE